MNEGLNLICGDTPSDVPMIETALSLMSMEASSKLAALCASSVLSAGRTLRSCHRRTCWCLCWLATQGLRFSVISHPAVLTQLAWFDPFGIRPLALYICNQAFVSSSRRRPIGQCIAAPATAVFGFSANGYSLCKECKDFVSSGHRVMLRVPMVILCVKCVRSSFPLVGVGRSGSVSQPRSPRLLFGFESQWISTL